MKETAAVSALFIFVNSLSDLAGIFTTGFEYKPEIVWLIVIAFAGILRGLTSAKRNLIVLFWKDC